MNFCLYAGTYSSPESAGIYRINLDGETGALSGGALALSLPDAKYLARRGDALAAAYGDGREGGVRLLRRGVDGLAVTQTLPQGRVAPCYAAFLGPRLVTANYHEGRVHVYREQGGGLELERVLDLGEGAGCHQTLVWGELLLVPCLERDRIALFHWGEDCRPAGALPLPPGSSPRHGVVSGDETHLWVVGERDNRLYPFRRSPQGIRPGTPLDILPPGAQADSLSAAIRLSPDGRFLTVSTRGGNLLTTWDTENLGAGPLQQSPCGGDHPRDFLITPDGRHLLCANRGSGEVVRFPRNPLDGRLGKPTHRIGVPQAVALINWEE